MRAVFHLSAFLYVCVEVDAMGERGVLYDRFLHAWCFISRLLWPGILRSVALGALSLIFVCL